MWYLFKVNSKDTRTTSMMSLLLTLRRFHNFFYSFSVVDLEQVNAHWFVFSATANKSVSYFQWPRRNFCFFFWFCCFTEVLLFQCAELNVLFSGVMLNIRLFLLLICNKFLKNYPCLLSYIPCSCNLIPKARLSKGTFSTREIKFFKINPERFMF